MDVYRIRRELPAKGKQPQQLDGDEFAADLDAASERVSRLRRDGFICTVYSIDVWDLSPQQMVEVFTRAARSGHHLPAEICERVQM